MSGVGRFKPLAGAARSTEELGGPVKLALRRFLRAFFIYGGLLAFFAVFGKASVETKIVAVVLCGLGIAAVAT